MMREPKIAIEIASRGVSVPLPQDLIRKNILKMLMALHVSALRLEVVFLSSRLMQRLNRKHLGHDWVTDVVTFDLSSEKGKEKRGKGRGKTSFHFSHFTFPLEGEVYICPAEARRNAREHAESFEREVLRYIAHGLLHLLGHDDKTIAQRKQMGEMEDRLLSA